MKEKNSIKIQKSSLYSAIDKLLYTALSKLEKQIQHYLDTTNLGLEVYWTKSKPYLEEYMTNWSLALNFDDYQWSYKIGKPHYLSMPVVTLIEVADKNKFDAYRMYEKKVANDDTLIILISNKIVSSFNSNPSNPDKYEIHLNGDELENKTIQNQQLKIINNLLGVIYTQFIKEINVININDLEKYSIDEILITDKEIQDDNKKTFHNLLELEKQGIKQNNDNNYKIACYYDAILKDYKNAIHYYKKYLKYTSDEKSKQRIYELQKLI